MADVKADLDRYTKAMMMPNGWSICLAIERKYGLDGYPPEIVSAWFAAEIQQPGSGNRAVDAIISGGDENDQEADRESRRPSECSTARNRVPSHIGSVRGGARCHCHRAQPVRRNRRRRSLAEGERNMKQITIEITDDDANAALGRSIGMETEDKGNG